MAISSFQKLLPIEEVKAITVKPFHFRNKCANLLLSLYDHHIGGIEALRGVSQPSNAVFLYGQ